MPKLREVIEHLETRGKGTTENPFRWVYQIYSTNGELLAEKDPHVEHANSASDQGKKK